MLTPGGPGQGKPRKHTLSIAIPGSVVDNAQNRELKTYLVGAMLLASYHIQRSFRYDRDTTVVTCSVHSLGSLVICMQWPKPYFISLG